MATERISQILPSVKCSDCGRDVQIRRLGDHVCSSKPPVPELPIIPKAKDIGLSKKYNKDDDFYRPLPRKNSTSPAPTSPNSYRSNDYKSRYDDRKPSYQQQSYSTPTTKKSNDSSSSGALDNLMADLMNSMTDDTPCAVCNKPIYDDMKTAGNKCYHKACFICRLCSTPFDNRRTHNEYEGKLYCERDYYVVKNRIMCASCDRVIPPSITPVKALGKFYHPGHLSCYHCHQNIDERTGWKEYQGKVYCRQDFKELFLPKCRACKRPVEKNAVSAMDGKLKGKWHLECFGCHTCHRPFPDNTFYVFQDAPYCKRHYHELNNSLCRRCDDPIEGYCAYTSPENWRFHPNCFTCEICHKRLDDEYYVAQGRIYCEADIRRQYHHNNKNYTKRKTQMYNI